MKHRRPTQHIRRYRSGRWALVNKGIKYRKTNNITKNYSGFIRKKSIDEFPTKENLTDIKEDNPPSAEEKEFLLSLSNVLYSSLNNDPMLHKKLHYFNKDMIKALLAPSTGRWASEPLNAINRILGTKIKHTIYVEKGQPEMNTRIHISLDQKEELFQKLEDASLQQQIQIFDFLRAFIHEGPGYIAVLNLDIKDSPHSFLKAAMDYLNFKVTSKEDLIWFQDLLRR